jgi:hypothetical protein
VEPPPESNRRPHPYHGSRPHRRAHRRLCRSLAIVDRQVMCWVQGPTALMDGLEHRDPEHATSRRANGSGAGASVTPEPDGAICSVAGRIAPRHAKLTSGNAGQLRGAARWDRARAAWSRRLAGSDLDASTPGGQHGKPAQQRHRSGPHAQRSHQPAGLPARFGASDRDGDRGGRPGCRLLLGGTLAVAERLLGSGRADLVLGGTLAVAERLLGIVIDEGLGGCR